MSDNYDGQKLISEDGDTIGTIERTYVDDIGQAHLLALKTAGLMGKHRLAPAGDTQTNDGGLSTPYTKSQIEDSPEADPGEELGGDLLEQVRAYYDGLRGEEQASTGTAPGAVPASTAGDAKEAKQDQPNQPAKDSSDIRTEASSPDIGKVRDLGDVIEIPVVEEVLVKKQVVREVLRVRKSEVVEKSTAQGELRSEDVEIIPSDDSLISEGSDKQ